MPKILTAGPKRSEVDYMEISQTHEVVHPRDPTIDSMLSSLEKGEADAAIYFVNGGETWEYHIFIYLPENQGCFSRRYRHCQGTRNSTQCCWNLGAMLRHRSQILANG